jgi:hypothetical protein
MGEVSRGPAEPFQRPASERAQNGPVERVTVLVQLGEAAAIDGVAVLSGCR